MFYSGSQYPLYVPPYISGYEKVKITITKRTPTEEMEQRIKMRYAFALSAFSRMFTPGRITQDMKELCNQWSENVDDLPPSWDLYRVDRYFLEIWKSRSQQ